MDKFVGKKMGYLAKFFNGSWMKGRFVKQFLVVECLIGNQSGYINQDNCQVDIYSCGFQLL